MLLCGKGYEIVTAASAKEALEILEHEYFPLVITDILMPGIDGIEFLKQIKSIYNNTIEVIMVTGYGSIETAVQTMKMGAFGYFIKSHDPEELVLEIKKVEKMMELTCMNIHNESQSNKDALLGSKNKEMHELWELVQQVAASKASILIMGESGVGKEIVAQRLHQISGRGKRPFIPLNCQHYPENLIESELFGHEKGAFTGALSKRVGKLEETNGGTIFLDEIGDMDLGTQVKLLRVLESRQIERIGSNKLINVDFRLISATNKNVYEKVKEGTFREDFLYRINTIEIHIPPLRKRREDLEDFIEFFLQRFSRETGKSILEIEPRTKEFLLNYDYPGNVRELKNMIERLVILSNNGVLQINQSEQIEIFEENLSSSSSQDELLSYKEAKQEFEKKYIKEALFTCGNNITKTAERMGMSRRQLFNKIVEYKIDTSEK
ncbi:sigma-54 dependent transcriptional regulator [Sinanaerobacter sp. ZZT-01]|uniref:sigma-54-dependent transcriptional regulator n=1 Tax=Sinanaerobacter sp. ZZT-01 TaxID=3111540 RepID=UPI002D7725F3|nr:sigma-54 dependent transcriptional regulator [Sinanaerobacter sp. ZZT-01]WRR94912.1 sigma-54 dependent transcriptional regulator [Sinanaerobacter sp. ZZT-01]